MKPNYKALAEEYRRRNYTAEERLVGMCEALRRKEEALRKKEQERDEWKKKYCELLDRLIKVQEHIAMVQEEGT